MALALQRVIAQRTWKRLVFELPTASKFCDSDPTGGHARVCMVAYATRRSAERQRSVRRATTPGIARLCSDGERKARHPAASGVALRAALAGDLRHRHNATFACMLYGNGEATWFLEAVHKSSSEPLFMSPRIHGTHSFTVGSVLHVTGHTAPVDC